MESCSSRGAPLEPDGESREEPEEHKRLFSVQRLHCPGVLSKAKDEENCPYTSLQIKTQLIQFIALFFLSISSVSTEQWQQYAKNLKTIKIERGNL